MTTPNPEHVNRLINVINNAPYFQLLSMKILEIGIGYSVTEINLTDKHLNPFGGAHGGVFSSIIDSAASWALFYGVEDENAGLASVNLNLNYLSPAKEGKLIAEGRQIKLGKTLGYALCKVSDTTGKLLAHGTLTVMIIPGHILAYPPGNHRQCRLHQKGQPFVNRPLCHFPQRCIRHLYRQQNLCFSF